MSSSNADRRHEVMGGRTRKVGYTGHVPMCTTFGDSNPFHKSRQQQQQLGASANRMTQDNVSLRKGMSSQTSYAAVARAVEAKHRQVERDEVDAAAARVQQQQQQEQEQSAAAGQPHVSVAPPPRRSESPHAPQLHPDLFGCSPPAVKLVSGFGGHRAQYAFAVGESCNATRKDDWRAHAFAREREVHHRLNHVAEKRLPAAQQLESALRANAERSAGSKKAERDSVLC